MWRKVYVFLQIVFLISAFNSPLLGKEQSVRIIPNPLISNDAKELRAPAIKDLVARQVRDAKSLGRDVDGVGHYATIKVEIAGIEWSVDLSLATGFLCYATSRDGTFKAFRSQKLHDAVIEITHRESPRFFEDIVLMAESFPAISHTTPGPIQELLKRKPKRR